jgi:hypothetical protein
MALAWRRHTNRPLLRLAGIIITAVVCVLGFAVASGFSSRIASSTRTEVLLDGSNCGVLLAGVPLMTTNYEFVLNKFQPYVRSAISSSSSYATQCYNNNSATSGFLTCSTFASRSLPSFADSNAPCPFNETNCKNQKGNVLIDTGYLDIIEHFGLRVHDSSSDGLCSVAP